MEMENTVLVIYLSPYNGLASSTMRTLGMIKGLVDNGYCVDLLTIGFKSDKDNTKRNGYDFLDKVNVILAETIKPYDQIASRKKSLKSRFVNNISKIYRLFFIFGHTERLAKSIDLKQLPRSAYDYAVSVSDPKTSHIALYTLFKQGLHIEEVIEYWGDPLYGDITLKSIYPKAILKKCEKAMLLQANRIVYTSPFTLKAEQRIYPELSDRMYFVPTAVIEEKIYTKEKKTGRFTIGYYGAYLSNVRNIIPLYNACSKLENRVQLNIIGDTDIHLEEKENILVKSRGDVEEYERNTDLLVCILNLTGTQIPGKLYYNAATNLPVLVILDGDNELKDELRHFLEEFNRYYLCENNEEAILKAIEWLLNNEREWKPCEALSARTVASRIIDKVDE